MQENENHSALIEKYLTDTLTDSEKADFLLLMEDQELKERVLAEKRVVLALKAIERGQLKDRLKIVSQDTPTTQPQASMKWWLFAASIAIIFTVGYFFYSVGSAEKPFNKFYEPYPAVTIQRGQAIDIEEGLMLYSQGKFKKAIPELERLPLNEKPAYYLYLGNCYLQTKQPDKAVESFQSLIQISDDPILKQHAQWYLALAYLQQKREDQALLELNKIIENKGIYAEEAEELTEELQ